MAHEFWLSDKQWAAIEPCLPRNQPGARRVDDRRVLSGIIHVLRSGCRWWRDCPPVYGPYTTVYNRWNRWSGRRVWQKLFEALRWVSPYEDFQAIDSTTPKAHRSAAGGKGGGCAGDRPFAQWQNHKDRCGLRQCRQDHRVRSDARPTRRCPCGRRAARPAVAAKGLRRRYRI